MAIAVLAVPVFLGVAVAPAGATTTHLTRSATVAHVTEPNVNLVGHDSSVTFRPSELSVQDKTPTSCTRIHGEWTMTNTTKQTLAVLIEGHQAFTLKPSRLERICTGLGKWVFSLTSSPLAVLIVRATA